MHLATDSVIRLSRAERAQQYFEECEWRRRIRNEVPQEIAPRGVVEVNRFVLQCRLFSIATLSPSELRTNDAVPRMHVNARFEAGYSAKPRYVEYDGVLLTQDHRVVLEGLIDVAKGMSPREWIEIHPRKFAAEQLGWSPNAYSAKKVRRALLDMRGAKIKGPWGDEGTEEWLTLIEGLELGSKVFRVKFHFSILHLFRGSQLTLLPPSQLRKLKPGIETWLWGFVRSSDCQRVFTTNWFYRMSGASTCKSEEEFSRDLGKALEKLVEMKVIQGYTRARGEVRIRKK